MNGSATPDTENTSRPDLAKAILALRGSEPTLHLYLDASGSARAGDHRKVVQEVLHWLQVAGGQLKVTPFTHVIGQTLTIGTFEVHASSMHSLDEESSILGRIEALLGQHGFGGTDFEVVWEDILQHRGEKNQSPGQVLPVLVTDFQWAPRDDGHIADRHPVDLMYTHSELELSDWRELFVETMKNAGVDLDGCILDANTDRT